MSPTVRCALAAPSLLPLLDLLPVALLFSYSGRLLLLLLLLPVALLTRFLCVLLTLLLFKSKALLLLSEMGKALKKEIELP
jgi:hypothetical protein